MNQTNPERPVMDAMTGYKKRYLYHYNGCLFCWRVKRLINKLGITVELRDIWQSNDYRRQLIEARGRQTVPVLLEVDAEGNERWIPESGDIIKHLSQLQHQH